MALIRCPECGRQNVSDTAVACPECGYAIREHFERIKDEEEREVKRIQEYQQHIEEEEKRRIIERIDAVKKINENIDQYKANMIFFTVLLVPLLGILIYSKFSVGGIILVACDLLLLYRIKSKLDKSKKSLQLSELNREQFDKNVEEERLKTEAIRESRQRIKEKERARQERIKEAQHPVCPNCGSKNTHRISTASRAVSTAAWGVASSTVGKQYKCDDCKHMW